MEENNIRPIEFKLFYWMDLIQLLFLSIVYWLLAINLDYFSSWFDGRDPGEKTDSKTEELGFSLILILLKYIPNIFLTLNYMLLYFQMEHLFIVSKIQSSNMMQNQMSQK